MKPQSRKEPTKKNASKSTKWVPPRGIRFIPLPAAPLKPFGVQWWIEGRRKTKGFPSLEARETFARSLAGDVKSIGVAAYRLNESEAKAWRAFTAQIDGTPLDDVLRCWQRHGKPSVALTVSEAIASYTAAKRTEGVDEGSIAHYGPIFDRFEAFAGKRDVSTISREDIHDFMSKQADAPSDTRKTRFARIRALFNWLSDEEKISGSPFKGMKTPKVKTKPVVILTLAQTKALFERNTEGEIDQSRRETMGRLALEAFAGLRHDSAGQIIESEIHPDGLRIPAAKIKTQQDQFIEGLPANLYPWLKWSNPKEWAMTQRQYLEAKTDAFTRANIPHPRNCLRKGFASYHVAAFKNKALTALIMCHSSAKLLEKTYRGAATEADGKEVFAIMPPKDIPKK